MQINMLTLQMSLQNYENKINNPWFSIKSSSDKLFIIFNIIYSRIPHYVINYNIRIILWLL